jgi:hypothetical protein
VTDNGSALSEVMERTGRDRLGFDDGSWIVLVPTASGAGRSSPDVRLQSSDVRKPLAHVDADERASPRHWQIGSDVR